MIKRFATIALLALGLAACAPAPAASLPVQATRTPAAIAPPAQAPLAATTAPTAAPAAQLEKVTIAEAPVPYLFDLTFDVARGLDLFKQEGLDVQVDHVGGGALEDELASGGVDFIVKDPAIAAQAEGKNLTMIAGVMQRPPLTVLVRGDLKDKIKTIADLKGEDIQMAGDPGTVESKLMRYLLAKAGLTNRDTAVHPGGSLSLVLDDIKSGRSIAALLGDPYAVQVEQDGKWYPLVDLAGSPDSDKYLGSEYQLGLITSAHMIQDHPQTVQKMTNAVVEALRYIQTHSPAEITAILPDDVSWVGKGLYSQGIQHSLPAFSKDGLITESGIRSWIAVDQNFGSIKPDQQIDVGALYTNQFVANVK